MSTHLPGSEIFGKHQQIMDPNGDGDPAVDAWLGRMNVMKKHEKSQNGLITKSTPSVSQMNANFTHNSQPLPTKQDENFWNKQESLERAHLSTSSRPRTAFMNNELLSEGAHENPPLSTSHFLRTGKKDPHSDVEQMHPFSSVKSFQASSIEGTASNASLPPSQADEHANMRQEESHWPQVREIRHLGQQKHVSFDQAEANATHSFTKPTSRPSPVMMHPAPFSLPDSTKDQMVKLNELLKHMFHIQQTYATCLHDVKRLVDKEQEACKHFCREAAELNDRITIFETSLGEKEAQIKSKEQELANKDAQIEAKDAQLKYKDIQLEGKDAQMAEKDSNEIEVRRSSNKAFFKAIKASEICNGFSQDAKYLHKEWEVMETTLKSDFGKIQQDLEMEKEMNKVLSGNFDALKLNQNQFKDQLAKHIEDLKCTEKELEESKRMVSNLNTKLKAAEEDAHKAQEEFGRKLESKDCEVQIADAARLDSKQELLQMQKELDLARMSTTTKTSDLIKANDTIKQMQEEQDGLKKMMNEQERTANEGRSRNEEMRKAFEQTKRELEKKEIECESLKSEQEAMEKSLSLCREQILTLEKAGFEREEGLKVREEGSKSRSEDTSKGKKEIHDRDQESVKTRNITLQSNEDAKGSKSSSAGRKRLRVEPPPMDSD